ncbi:hypothetical protein [Actinoplanes sp. M2I2]|uniref:hypothetical protein n=1 Tax=Actinoplanes sp. M2I2 TaxID=1734444 RepID=UPI002021C5B0|nr:hypothetical protein [Actinoplanes sp. M2I2]
MLSDRDRTLLAPHLALLRSAQKDLAAARRGFDEAERGLAESSGGTDWRDRMLGGLFSADDGRTQRYRRARDARRAAEKTLAEAEAAYAKYAQRMDGLLDPILTRDDPGFRALLDAVRACDKALRACEGMRRAIAATLRTEAPKGKPVRDSESWHEAEAARRRRTELVDDIRAKGPGLGRTIERAARAVEEVTGEAPRRRIELDTGDVAATGMAVDQRLRALQLQLDGAIKEIGRWRAAADQARASALRAAHDKV